MKAKSVFESFQDIFKPKDKEELSLILGIDPEKEAQIRMHWDKDFMDVANFNTNIKVKAEYWENKGVPRHWMVLTGKVYELWKVFCYYRDDYTNINGTRLAEFKKKLEFED